MTWDVEAVANHEIGLLEILLDLSAPGERFVDIGAHLGKYAIGLALEDRRVVAVEPNPEIIPLLEDNMAAAAVAFPILPVVAWNTYTRLSMIQVADSGSTRFVEDSHGNLIGRPLDDLLADAQLVKIDVEGAELRVLQGMVRLTRRFRPRFVIELHEQIFPDIRGQVEDWFASLDYTVGVCYEWEGSKYLLAQ